MQDPHPTNTRKAVPSISAPTARQNNRLFRSSKLVAIGFTQQQHFVESDISTGYDI